MNKHRATYYLKSIATKVEKQQKKNSCLFITSKGIEDV